MAAEEIKKKKKAYLHSKYEVKDNENKNQPHHSMCTAIVGT